MVISLTPTRRIASNAFELAKRTAADTLRDRVPGLAAEMAFFSVLALPPLTLVVLGAVGFVADFLGQDVTQELQANIIKGATSVFTDSTVSDLVRPAINSLFAQGRADVVTVGIILSLWSASRATRTVILGVAAAYDLERDVPWWRDRLAAFGLTLAGIVTMVIVMPLLVIGPSLGEGLAARFGLGEAFRLVWARAYWPTVAVLGIVLITWLYHLVTPETTYRRDLPGSLLALVIWAAGSFALRVYATEFLEGNSAYSLFAAPFAVMLWLYLSAFAMLIGAEFNAEIEKMWPSGLYDRPLNEPLPRTATD
ncbi:MAG: YihY/virulence factor BrkB family protein [Acidimicrobiia bacterium]|nr:YihY/virulence factor BrkB family protein [Acidimicrobiia bacterium]